MGRAAMPPHPRMTGTLTALCAGCQGICCAARWVETVWGLLCCRDVTTVRPAVLCKEKWDLPVVRRGQ